MISTAAAASTAGAGTATTATTYRLVRSDGKTRTISSFQKVYLNGTAGFKQSLLNQKLNTTFFKSLIIFFWLIQSQSQ